MGRPVQSGAGRRPRRNQIGLWSLNRALAGNLFSNSRCLGMGVASEKTEFLTGGGLMGALLTDHDWSESPLGPPAHWTSSLKTTVGLLLRAEAQIVLFWGPQFVALYNDAYAPTIGD